MDEPDQFLGRLRDRQHAELGPLLRSALDDLFSRQARTLDPAERKKLVGEIEKIVLDNAYYMPGSGGRATSCTGQGEELRGPADTTRTRSCRTSGCRRMSRSGGGHAHLRAKRLLLIVPTLLGRRLRGVRDHARHPRRVTRS
jgi:hypothetical protein